MELVPELTAMAHRVGEDTLDEILSTAADEIAEELMSCTLFGNPIDFENENMVIVAVYELGRAYLEEEK